MPSIPQLSVRPPWPDERPRLKTFLQNFNPGEASEAHLFVLQADNPERIVGAAALVVEAPATREDPNLSPYGRLSIKIRPRFVRNDAAKLLFADVLDRANELKLEQLSAEVSTGDSLTTSALAEAGFEHRKTEELWRLDLPLLQRRLQRIARARPLPETWLARAPAEADLPVLGKMAEHYRFRQSGDIRFDAASDRPGTHYSAELSSVIEADGSLLAAVLAKASTGLNCHTDLRLTTSEVRSQSARLNLALLSRSVPIGIAAGYATTTLTVNTARDRETRHLAIRSGGQLLQSKELWTCDLAPSSPAT